MGEIRNEAFPNERPIFAHEHGQAICVMLAETIQNKKLVV
jgi:hypothetical protein